MADLRERAANEVKGANQSGENKAMLSTVVPMSVLTSAYMVNESPVLLDTPEYSCALDEGLVLRARGRGMEGRGEGGSGQWRWR